MRYSVPSMCLMGLTLIAVGCGQPSSGAGSPVDATITVTGPDGQPLKDVVLRLNPTSTATNPAFYKLEGKPVEAKSILPGTYIYYFEEIETGPQASKSRAVLKAMRTDLQSPKDTNTVEIKAGAVTIAVK